MESELIELFEAAKKAADAAAIDGVTSSGPEVSRSLDALKQLKKFPITYDMLVATQVGKKLRSLSKHPIEEIKTVATDLLETWKKLVIEETSKSKLDRKDVDKTPNPAPVKVQKLQRGDSAKSIKVEERKEPDNKVNAGASKENQSSTKAPAKAPLNGAPKLTSMVKCNDPVRDKIRELLVDAMSKVHDESDDYDRARVVGCDPIRVAVSVESHMFEKLGRSTGAQKVKYRSIMFNLRDSNNPDLRRRVLTGEVSPEKLITLSGEEMASDKRKQETNQIKEKFLFDCERGQAPKASTDQFKCGRCGQRKCTYYQMQTRSADEPMTTYVTCVNCDNHWKFC